MLLRLDFHVQAPPSAPVSAVGTDLAGAALELVFVALLAASVALQILSELAATVVVAAVEPLPIALVASAALVHTHLVAAAVHSSKTH